MTNIIPLNDIARNNEGLDICLTGFISTKSDIYVLTRTGSIKKVKQYCPLRISAKTRVMLAPSGLVRDIVRTNINRTEDLAYAVYDLLPTPKMIASVNKSRLLLASCIVFFVMCSVYLIDILNILNKDADDQISTISLQKSIDDIIAESNFADILDILKNDSIISQVEKRQEAVHKAEFIERIRSFHSAEQRNKEGGQGL